MPTTRTQALLDFQPGSVPLLRAELSARGVRAARLHAWPVRGRSQHLARAASASLSLDTPGYNQGASGLDALWSGLPLVSLPLRQWCGRMGLGLLRGAALLPGVVSSRREIEDLVLALGRDAAASPRGARRASSFEPLRSTRRRRPGPQPARIEVSVGSTDDR